MKKLIFWAVAITVFIPLLVLIALRIKVVNTFIDWLDLLSDWANIK